MINTLILGLHLLLHTIVPPSVRTPKSPEKIDISGYWEGVITRDEGYGRRVSFQIEVNLIQKGNEITGYSIVKAVENNKTYSAKMDLVGKINRGYFKYIETKILASDPIPDAEWCIKKVELIYKSKNNVPTLQGMWEGITGSSHSCIPGRVELTRKPPRV